MTTTAQIIAEFMSKEYIRATAENEAVNYTETMVGDETGMQFEFEDGSSLIISDSDTVVAVV